MCVFMICHFIPHDDDDDNNVTVNINHTHTHTHVYHEVVDTKLFFLVEQQQPKKMKSLV